MASVKFNCTLCGKELEAELDTAGTTMQCPHCSGSVRVPSAGAGVTPPAGQPGPVPRTCGTAIWSFVLSLVAFFCLGPLAGIPAIICGHVAKGNIDRSQGMLTGRGLAIAGLIIGYVATAGWLLYIIFFGGLAFLGALSEM
jgi:DNA-directed RNA polymerase subunit RPC12/RpoP